MTTYNNSGGFTGTLGECVQAVAEVDNTPNEYYISFVQDELENLLDSYDSLYNEYGILSANIVIKKVKELLEEKIEIINNGSR
jgi:hypothetical protein